MSRSSRSHSPAALVGVPSSTVDGLRHAVVASRMMNHDSFLEIVLFFLENVDKGLLENAQTFVELVKRHRQRHQQSNHIAVHACFATIGDARQRRHNAKRQTHPHDSSKRPRSRAATITLLVALASG